MKTALTLCLATSLQLLSVSAVLAQSADSAPAEAAPANEQRRFVAKNEAADDRVYNELLRANGGDHDPGHWASEAIQGLVGKYCGIMVGYPDQTFRGPNGLNRFEMAAALYKLMGCIEEQMVKIPQPEPLDTSNFVSKTELEQIAALQKEFRQELDALKNQQLDLGKRISELERVQVHGSVQARYRERVMTTDGTFPESPLFAPGNSSPDRRVNLDSQVEQRPADDPNRKSFSNNVNQFGRDQYGIPNVYHSPSEANITPDDLAPFRMRTRLNIQADWSSWMRTEIGFDMFELGMASSMLSPTPVVVSNGGHDVNEGLPDGSPLMFRLVATELRVPDTGHRIKFGLMNFAGQLQTGTRLSSLFDQGNWNGRDYGMVGWGASPVALSNNGDPDYRNSLFRYWQGGLNASMVDPDSHRYNQATSPAIAYDSDWGWGSFMVGLNAGSFQTNRLLAAQGNLSSGLPVNGSDPAFGGVYGGAILQGRDLAGGNLIGNHLALPSQFGDGYGVFGLEGRFFEDGLPLRLQLAGMAYLNDQLLNFTGPSRKELSGTLDLGWDQNFGLTLQVNKSFIGFDRHSAGLFFNDIAGSGVDLQLGANLATRGLFQLQNLAAGSVGAALGITLWEPEAIAAARPEQLKLIVAARQSLGDRWGNLPAEATSPNQLLQDSGLTVSLPWQQVGGLNLDLSAQYSLLMADQLWAFRAVAHDVSVVTTLHF